MRKLLISGHTRKQRVETRPMGRYNLQRSTTYVSQPGPTAWLHSL